MGSVLSWVTSFHSFMEIKEIKNKQEHRKRHELLEEFHRVFLENKVSQENRIIRILPDIPSKI